MSSHSRKRGARDTTSMVGLRFGKLVVVGRGSDAGCRFASWECRCDCGGMHNATAPNLKAGRVKSCGCASAGWRSGRRTTHGETVGHKPSTEYVTWFGAKERCHNPANATFWRYGARGISMCERWRTSFSNFLADMGRKPHPKSSLDRIDNNGNYEPGNCRWATIKQQARNKRGLTSFQIFGENMCAAEMADRYGVDPQKLRHLLLRRPVNGTPCPLLPMDALRLLGVKFDNQPKHDGDVQSINREVPSWRLALIQPRHQEACDLKI